MDYTQDFSGTLDRPTLVEFLETECEFGTKNKSKILDNTQSVGNNVCTWISNIGNKTIRTKVYNKIVSNFEAGEVYENFGGHLADYVDCPNTHLQKTFSNKDVQARGCTRIEISVYGDSVLDSNSSSIDSVLCLLSRKPLFVVQPAVEQWKALARAVDRNLLVADRPSKKIFLAWYGSSTTKKIAGIQVRPTSFANWEKAIEWAITEFGWRSCPIFRIDILATTDSTVRLGTLRAYTKAADTQTYLSASKRPCQLHTNAPNIESYLPSTEFVSWKWRTKKCHAIGKDKPTWNIQEIPEIAGSRHISTLSTRNRLQHLLELRDAKDKETWKRSMLAKMEVEWENCLEKQRIRQLEIQKLRQYSKWAKEQEQKSKLSKSVLEETLQQQTEKVAPGDYRILGYRQTETSTRVVLQCLQNTASNEEIEPIVVWTTAAISKILAAIEDTLEFKMDKFFRKQFWVKDPSIATQISIQDPKTFVVEQKTISYFPIRVLRAPNRALLRDLQKQMQEFHVLEEKTKQDSNKILQEIPKIPRALLHKLLDISPGTYTCNKFSVDCFRGSDRTVLVLERDGKEFPAFGVFLKKK